MSEGSGISGFSTVTIMVLTLWESISVHKYYTFLVFKKILSLNIKQSTAI